MKPLAFLALAATLALTAPIAEAKRPRAPAPDLADRVAGSYSGDVVSDARGSSRSDVQITVTRTARNTVSIHSDYARIPDRTFRLIRAMETIQSSDRGEVFLYDMNKLPHSLMLTIDDAAWGGTRSGVAP